SGLEKRARSQLALLPRRDPVKQRPGLVVTLLLESHEPEAEQTALEEIPRARAGSFAAVLLQDLLRLREALPRFGPRLLLEEVLGQLHPGVERERAPGVLGDETPVGGFH